MESLHKSRLRGNKLMGSRSWLIWLFMSFSFMGAQAQEKDQAAKHENKALIHYLNEDKTHYIKFGGYAQIWARYTELNPGSKIDESAVKNTSDISLRRVRMKMTVLPIDHFTMVAQVGATNLNQLSNVENAVELLDLYGEYQFSSKFTIGAGRSAWKGLTRFASGPSATLLYDVPLITLGNVNRTDLTLRNLNVFVKGQLNRLDYRFVLAKPYISAPVAPVQGISGFNNLAVKPGLSGYVKFQLLEKESDASPTSAGSYLGKKKVLSIGVGAEFQSKAMWSLKNQDTVLHDLKIFSADVFFDTPLNKQKGTAFNIYAAAFHHDYGPGYVRNLGINNIANGTEPGLASFNGAGDSYPVVGTGNSFIIQSGYTLPYFNQRKKDMRLMPAVGFQYSKFDRLADPMMTYDLGLSLLLKDHLSKFVFNAQNRPIYKMTAGELRVTERKMMYVLMYQINID